MATKKNEKVSESFALLAGQYNELVQMALDTDVDAEALEGSFESMEGLIEAKANGIGFVFTSIEAEKETLTARAKYYKALAKGFEDHVKALENKQERMKTYVMECMIAAGLDEKGIHTDCYDISIKGKGGLQPLEITGDVPEQFCKVTIAPDNDKIREFLKDNTCDWARLLPRGKRVEIK